jgi:hypothetical protein
MSRATIICLALVTITCAFAPAFETESYKGYAYEKGSKSPLYTEAFTDKFIDGKKAETTTLYYNDEQKLIARRTLDFSESQYAPDFKTEDLRTGFMEGAEKKGHSVRLFFRKNSDADLEEKTIRIPEPAVVDGGFNQYIKDNWSALVQGEAVTFYFAVPNRLDYYKLRATKVSSSASEMTIRIQPDQSVLRWIASPIVVKYNTDSKRIISYEGKSNIQHENGNNPVIKLLYPKKGP